MSIHALRATGTSRVGDRELSIDLAVETGEIVALVGPNGAGKSTTLEVLVGLRRLTSGTIEAGGRMLADTAASRDLPPDARRLGWVPQSPSLLPRRTMRDQVGLFAEPARAPLLRGSTTAQLLERLLLADLATARPAGLSRGQAQRVAVARALANSDVVLFDEATSAQDPDGAVAVRHAIRDHVAAGGAALLVAHRPDDAWVLADRAVVLEDLAPVQSGEPAELASRPATTYVALVAGLTVLRGTVDDGHVLSTGDGELVVGDQAPTGAAVALVRPAAVTLHRERPEGQSARNVVASTVVSIEHTQAGLRVVLQGRPSLTASLTEQAARSLALAPGMPVWASVKATDVEVRPA